MTKKRMGYQKNGEFYVWCEDHYEKVTEDVYRVVMDDEWKEEKHQQRDWRCRDGKGFRCNKNCEECELYRLGVGPTGSVVSLDQLYEENEYEPMGSSGFEESVALENDINEAIEKCKNSVPDLTRIVVMVENGELLKEVAAELGIPVNTLRSRRDKALEKLGKYLQNYR